MIAVLQATTIAILVTSGLAFIGYGLWLIVWDIREQLRSRRLS